MNRKDLDLVKLSKLTSDYNDELKCLECCKYFIAPTTASCGHTLCHTCWRGRRTCPTCSKTLERKLLRPNLPLQDLTNRVQMLSEAFEKLFNIKLDEFGLETQEEFELDKDPDKNVKDWLTSSQNHFSAPLQNSEPLTQDFQQPLNPLEVSASNIVIHTDAKKSASSLKMAQVVHTPQPQDDWDKIEVMPEADDKPLNKNKDNIVGPMDIEPFFFDDNEYSTDNPRRSSRKRDIKQDKTNQDLHEHSSNKHSTQHNSRDSSCENDKISQKGKQTWSNVKRMRKEFSKLNKKNRNKLNVSIEMVKNKQSVKPINNTPLLASQQIVSIDDKTPDMIDKENNVNSNNPIDKHQEAKSETNINNKKNTKGNNSINLSDDLNSTTTLVLHDNKAENKIIKKNNSITNSVSTTKDTKQHNQSQHKLKAESKMPFIKKSALCPRNIEVTCSNDLHNMEQQTVSGNSDDIEISIKIGTTVTNILIKKKSDIQVKINTDREVQTSLGPDSLPQNEISDKNKNVHNVDNIKTQTTTSQNTKAPVIDLKADKSTSGKKNTASADTGTAPPFEITESVEKELSNVMEYETGEEKQATFGITNTNNKLQEIKTPVHVDENVENLDDLNDLDIFNSGSVKEGTVQVLKEHAPSEILISTACSKLRTQRNTQKRNRENTDEEVLPKNKKVKATQQKAKDKNTPPDSEPINYDVIMGQVFANIDADIEDIRKSQDTRHVRESTDNKISEDKIKSKDASQVHKTQTIKSTNQSNSQIPATNLQEYFNARHSENVFSIMEKEDENCEISKIYKMPQQVEELLTPVLCRNLDSSQESNDGLHKKNKSNKNSQDYDDSDRSVVEETPQKDLSIPKLKRSSTSNLSQVSATKKIPSKASGQSIKSIINLTDTVTDSNKSLRDVTFVETKGKKLTLETPLTITKFADHIIHKSTPMARKSLNFDNQNEDDDDPEQTLCPTSEVIAKTTQEKEFLSKAFERTPTTPAARPLMTRSIVSTEKINYCLAASCLTSAEIAKVKILCAEHKWAYVDKYTKNITHLVVGVDEEKKSQRSVKYMCALAASKWIVSFDWINSCLRNKSIVDEVHFEALDSTGEPGPKRSRVAKQKLFQNIKFYCMQPFSVLDVNTLKSMLEAAGGCVVKDMKQVRVSGESAAPALLLAEPEHTQEDRFIYLAMEQSIVPVNYEWVLNCLGSYSLGSIQELLLCPSSLLPAVTARWPEVLIAQDSDYSKTD